jgi:hypothetical protein
VWVSLGLFEELQPRALSRRVTLSSPGVHGRGPAQPGVVFPPTRMKNALREGLLKWESKCNAPKGLRHTNFNECFFDNGKKKTNKSEPSHSTNSTNSRHFFLAE